MMRSIHGVSLVLFGALAVLWTAVLLAVPAGAAALQIRPLTYPANPADGFETLKPGEIKKGHIDVSNASHSPVTVQLKVKGFKQVDDAGNIQLFESKDLEKGILLDYDRIELQPFEALRLYFLLDGSKLPSGSVLAGIFAKTVDKPSSGITSQAEVGTLLIIQNGASEKKVSIESMDIPIISFSSTLSGQMKLRHDANKNNASAFFPNISLTLGPWFGSSTTMTGPLLSAGLSRSVAFNLPTNNQFGLYTFTVQSEGGYAQRWLFIISGFWRFVVVTALVTLLAVIYFLGRKRKIYR